MDAIRLRNAEKRSHPNNRLQERTYGFGNSTKRKNTRQRPDEPVRSGHICTSYKHKKGTDVNASIPFVKLVLPGKGTSCRTAAYTSRHDRPCRRTDDDQCRTGGWSSRRQTDTSRRSWSSAFRLPCRRPALRGAVCPRDECPPS